MHPLPTKFLKSSCHDVLLPLMCQIINQALTDGVFPSSMKLARVVPLIKNANLDKNNLKYYRTVSNLSFISKLIEKTVASQLIAHLNNNAFFEKFQSAYKAAHSTVTALLCVIIDLLMAVDKGRVIVLLLLDLSAAFNTIDHKTERSSWNRWYCA